MSEKNVEIVRRDYAAFERGDFDAILADVHPEVVVRAHPLGDEGNYEGHEGFLRFIANWTEQFEHFQQAPEEFIDAGDRVVVRVLQRARGRGSGVPVEGHFWLVHMLEAGQVTRVDLYDNEADALEAAGLSD
jgi:ketosteroid isomerase-like protein